MKACKSLVGILAGVMTLVPSAWAEQHVTPGAGGVAAEARAGMLADAESGEALAGSEDDVVGTAFDEMIVSDFVGRTVRTEAGEDVGEVDHLMIEDGRVTVVVGVGGFLGLGEKEVAIPLERFSMPAEFLVLNATTASGLADLPEYDGAGEAIPLDLTVGEAS